jgi:hypothetical protein
VHPALARFAALALLLATAGACRRTPAPPAVPVLSRAPDLTGAVARVGVGGTLSPGGPASEYGFFVLVVPPDTAARAQVVVPRTARVYLRTGGGALASAGAGDLLPGDAVAVWSANPGAPDAAPGPPGPPTYTAAQVVATRRASPAG